MRVLEVSEYGGPEVLRIARRPDPGPVPGRLRVRMHATAVNPADWVVRSGAMAAFTPDLAPPIVLGWDIAGTLLDDGPGPDGTAGFPEGAPGGGFRAGQRVVGLLPKARVGAAEGSNAEIVLAEPEWLAPVPEGADLTALATVPLNALTARQALDLLDYSPGDPVLVTGASGGVGGFATQLAAADGARVIAVASTGDEAYVKGLGAAHVLSRAEPAALAAAVREHAPDGVVAVLDAAVLGQPLLPAVRAGGSFVSATMSTPEPERDIRVRVVYVAPDPARLAEFVERVVRGELSTRIAAEFPIEQGAEAHRRAQAGGARGKILLTF
ncbi:NADP-dependent oxidoreductase [Micromonospora sp. NPDC049559]|uniref:NADP-dependent oxidoreductase n=1 Tax=Micromonospora sp. NPDC049559 TaxID=3155923 RepID=UPI0034135340